jgi:TldD protein
MSPTRRSFIASMGAGTLGMCVANDLVAQLLADSPRGRVLQSQFKGLSDIVLMEARDAGCSYADVRFTFRRNLPGGTAVFGPGGPGGGGPGGGGGGGGGGFGGGNGYSSGGGQGGGGGFDNDPWATSGPSGASGGGSFNDEPPF